MVQRMGQKGLKHTSCFCRIRRLLCSRPKPASAKHQCNQRGIFTQVEQRVPRRPENPISGGIKDEIWIHRFSKRWVGAGMYLHRYHQPLSFRPGRESVRPDRPARHWTRLGCTCRLLEQYQPVLSHSHFHLIPFPNHCDIGREAAAVNALNQRVSSKYQ